MTLRIQDPTSPTSISLHETLIGACLEAASGGGAFAFVTRGGLRLFVEDTAFTELTERGSFKLLVGLDEITDTGAVQRLSEAHRTLGGLEVTAFLHNGGGLFHPKFCWFKDAAGTGKLIIGSGNLTVGGLRNNWEAFTLLLLDAGQMNEVEATWNAWLDFSRENILAIDDEAVATKAAENVLKRQRVTAALHANHEVTEVIDAQVAAAAEEDVEPAEDRDPWTFDPTDRVLVAQIPRASDRWNQANFDKDNFENFFGATAGDNSHRILLRQLSADGRFGDIESRQSVSVASQNYRFELDAASGLDYPAQGRPTAIFIEVGPRMFLYTLLMPDVTCFTEIDRFLEENWNGREDRVKRIRTTVQELREICEELPFFHVVF